MTEAESIGEINEDQVFEAYQDAIKQNHTAPFEDFTQQNRDAYMRLKFRAMNPSFPKIPALPSNADLDLIDLGIVEVKPINFSEAFRRLEHKLTHVTVKHETLIQSIDQKLQQLQSKFIESSYELNKGQKDFAVKMTKNFEIALKKLKISYKNGIQDLDSGPNESDLFSEASSQVLESSMNFDEESKDDDMPLLTSGSTSSSARVAAALHPALKNGKRYFTESLLLTHINHVNLIISHIPGFNSEKTNFTLLYRASRDGWMWKDFHSRCDKKGGTVVLVKSSKGKISGGFTCVPWQGPKGWTVKPDGVAFVFSIDKLAVYPVIETNHSVIHCVKQGPAFGNALQIGVYGEPMNKENVSYGAGLAH
jgi:hypothetical protein